MPVRATVLVVDDDDRNRALVRGYLGSAWTVVEADGGAQALERLAAERVDLVLLDVMMPGRDGFDVCREVKSRYREPFLPVVLLTALGDQEHRNRGLEAGADDFLTKPVDRRELHLRVGALLRLREQEATIRRQIEELRRLQALKDDLVSLIIHDVRNPLTGLEGYLSLLREDVIRGSPLVGDVDAAIEASRRIREVLEAVLNVRLLEEGGLVLERAPTVVADLLKDAATTLEGAAMAKGVVIELAAAAGAVSDLDRKLTRRAVENLIANAVKYTHGGGKVSVSASLGAEGILVEVADQGPGIPDEAKDAVFDKYGSVEVRTGGSRRGIGLGLHLVKLVAEAHGGGASVHDRAGGGSVFRLLLPGRGAR